MITAIIGEIGGGKNQLLVYRGLRDIARGRMVVANFALDGAYPLIDIRDTAAPEYAGARFLFDEIGSQLNARATLDGDEMVFATASQSRKNVRAGVGGVDMDIVAQHLQLIDVQFRRLISEVLVVRRLGPSGEAVVNAVKLSGLQSFFLPLLRPWAFVYAAYKVDNFADDGQLKPGVVPLYTDWFLFSEKRAKKYNTLARVIPEHLVERWLAQLEAAKSHASLPPMIVENGQLIYQVLPDGYIPSILPMRPRQKLSAKDIPDVVPDSTVASVLASFGLVPESSLSPDVPVLRLEAAHEAP